MNSAMDNIFNRRSIRKYRDNVVEKEKLDMLMQAGMAAPSANNNRPWEFVVVTNTEAMMQFRERMPYGKFHAPAAIVVCGNPDIGSAKPTSFDYWTQDCSAATQNILIAAAGLGLGTCWLGTYPCVDRIETVRQIAGLPEKVIPLCVIYVGYPAEEKPARTQYDAARVHWERYDKK
jgi:nitroreductase